MFTVREARPEEYDAVGALTVEAYREAGLVDADAEYADTLRDVRDRAASAQVIVAVDPEDTLLATVTYVAAGTPYAELAGAGEAEFRMLAVTRAARRRGLAEALVSECAARARRAGCRRLLLCVQSGNEPASRLYARLGYARLPELDWEPAPGVLLQAYALALATRRGAVVPA